MPDNSANNKRIAKNTVLLYFRTIFTMLIALYTSRVILNVLGVEDYGVYNAVGGVVAMFAVISGALSSAISRFITFELGAGNKEKLSRIFCTSVNIQIVISLIIVLLGETLGLWFVNCKMSIPDGRMEAANWVLQCSLLAFVISLLSTPYNAAIIAHEHMKAYAYISILEALLKLGIVFLLLLSPIDKLISYAFLLFAVALIIRLIYGFYCHRKFEESKYHFIYDKQIFGEMFSFAGWNFLTNTAYILNTQGINVLINLYFGVAMNAARGIAAQVEGSIVAFVNNFSTAINPQITKTYAVGDGERLNRLICAGAKYSFFLLLFLILPVICEADYILKLWLKTVPEHTVVFVQLALVAAVANVIGNSGYIACMATGNIKKYVLIITPLGCLVFLITWLVYRMGVAAEMTYVVYFGVYAIIDVVRLFILRELVHFPVRMFITQVFLPMFYVGVAAGILPVVCVLFLPQGWARLCLTLVVSFVSVGMSVYVLGLRKTEREFAVAYFLEKFKKK